MCSSTAVGTSKTLVQTNNKQTNKQTNKPFLETHSFELAKVLLSNLSTYIFEVYSINDTVVIKSYFEKLKDSPRNAKPHCEKNYSNA